MTFPSKISKVNFKAQTIIAPSAEVAYKKKKKNRTKHVKFWFEVCFVCLFVFVLFC